MQPPIEQVAAAAERHVDVLRQFPRSLMLGDPLRPVGAPQGALRGDRRRITEAFVARGWGDENLPVPERGARLQDWLIGLRDEP